MANTDELARLPEDVREAWRNIDYATPDVRGTCIAPAAALETIFHDHMRLARENAELRRTDSEVAGPLAIKLHERAERAEAELAALKRRIADDYERGRQDGINFGPSVREQIDISRDLDYE
jgi:hypothetical protein